MGRTKSRVSAKERAASTFDYLRCEYPLPAGAPVEGYQTHLGGRMDLYELRADGTLWRQKGERERASDTMTYASGHVESRVFVQTWTQEVFTGEVCFSGDSDDGKEWSFSAYFVRGKLLHLETIARPEVVG